MKHPGKIKFIQIGNTLVVGKEWAKNSNYVTVGKEGFFWGDKNVLEQEQNGGCITLWLYKMTPSCIVQIINFILLDFI